MPYRHGPVPGVYEPAYIKREFERISEASDYQDTLGGLSLPLSDGPIAQTLTTTKEKINCWTTLTPTPAFGEGPVQTDPRISPASEIRAGQDGLYMVTFYMNYEHPSGDLIGSQLFINGLDTGLGSIVDASNQSSAGSQAFTSIFPMKSGNTIDVRVFTDSGTSGIDVISAAFGIFKMRDLRTRFS